MKQYIKNNIVPLLIGFAIALCFSKITETIADTIVKIELINQPIKSMKNATK